jgi:multicomponent Na+:H+ antiporter subunit F
VTSFFLGGAVALGLLLFLPLFRIVRGPTLYDRLVGASVMATKTTVLLVLMGHAVGRADMYVDVSLGYGLALLVGTLVATKYLESVVIRDPAARGDARDERPPKDATA